MILTRELLEKDIPDYKDAEYIEVPPIYTEIRKGTFAYLNNVKEIKLPETITKIHERAFWCCEKLEKINY